MHLLDELKEKERKIMDSLKEKERKIMDKLHVFIANPRPKMPKIEE